MAATAAACEGFLPRGFLIFFSGNEKKHSHSQSGHQTIFSLLSLAKLETKLQSPRI